jgi:predicted ester cyclase
MNRFQILSLSIVAGAVAVLAATASGKGVSPEQENHAAFQKILDKAINGHDVNALDDALTPDCVDHDLPPGAPRGPAGTKAKLGAFLTAFPDIKFTFENEVYQGDKLAGRGYFVGTHKGTFNGIPATGKQVKVKFMDLWRFEHGKLAEYWGEPDVFGLLQQLGAIPTAKP